MRDQHGPDLVLEERDAFGCRFLLSATGPAGKDQPSERQQEKKRASNHDRLLPRQLENVSERFPFLSERVRPPSLTRTPGDRSPGVSLFEAITCRSGRFSTKRLHQLGDGA